MDQIAHPPPPPIIPSELIAVILSFLPVKIIARFRCVSKTWKNLISDPSFIKIHLQKSSSLNPNFILSPFLHIHPLNTIISLPVSHLLNPNPSITTFSVNTFPNLLNDDEICTVVGSCNGLLCLRFQSSNSKYINFSFRLWNPATGTLTEKLGFRRENLPIVGIFKFTFGCDSLTGTYKIVLLHSVHTVIWKSNVRVFSVGDGGSGGDCWRNISSPVLFGKNSVHFNGTVNWLTLSEDLDVVRGSVKPVSATTHVDFIRIVSLDLSTEKFTRLLLPKSFNEVPSAESNLRVLLDCLCFCHCFRKTEFVIWQMKEFGVQDSWTQLFRFRFVDLQMPNIEVENLMGCVLLPLYVSKDGDTVILSNEDDEKAIIYNKRDNSVVRTAISNDSHWFHVIDYVESLVPTPWKSGDIEAKVDEGEDDDEEVGGGFFVFRVF